MFFQSMNARQQDAELFQELEKRWQINQKKHTQEVNDKIQQFKHECERMVKNRYAIENEKLILLSSRFEQTEKKFKVTSQNPRTHRKAYLAGVARFFLKVVLSQSLESKKIFCPDFFY